MLKPLGHNFGTSIRRSNVSRLEDAGRVNWLSIKYCLETSDATANLGIKRLGSYDVAKQKYIERYISSQMIY